MKIEDRDLVLETARRLARYGPPAAATSKDEDLTEAGRFLQTLSGALEPASPTPDVLHAACALLAAEADSRIARSRSHDLFDFLARHEEPSFPEERADLLCACAFTAWRAARRLGDAAAAAHWLAKIAEIAESTTASLSFETLLGFGSGAEEVEELSLDDPVRARVLCAWLTRRADARPEAVRAAAERLYALAAQRSVGGSGETAYLRGELALILGGTCRHLSRREEAHGWFDRSEGHFRDAGIPEADVSRVAYQRLAERMEERDLASVREALPGLEKTFRNLGMAADALKCRFLEGLTLMETDELPRAADFFEDVCQDAQQLGNEKLVATAYGNLGHIYGMMGDAESAISNFAIAIPLLRRVNDRVALAKVQWGLAALLRETGQLRAAVDAYRETRAELDSLGMRADVAAVSLVIAELFLELDEKADALREISSALPIIDELHMTQERVAALSLLRESARGQEVDRAALLELSRSLRDPKP